MNKAFTYIALIFLLLSIFFFFLGIGGKLLPGDIVIKKHNFVIIIPIVSMLILSIVLSIILNIIGKIWK